MLCARACESGVDGRSREQPAAAAHQQQILKRDGSYRLRLPAGHCACKTPRNDDELAHTSRNGLESLAAGVQFEFGPDAPGRFEDLA